MLFNMLGRLRRANTTCPTIQHHRSSNTPRMFSAAQHRPPPPPRHDIDPTGQIASPNDDGSSTKPPTAFELKLAAAKEKLQWRQPYSDRSDQWYTKFKLFGNERNEADNDMIAFMQQPFDFSAAARREKRERKRISDERFMQQFVPERHQKLGNDLAAAHFLVHRGGSVKFTNSPKWIRRDDSNPDERAYTLPSKYTADWLLEAIRCDGMELYYEGLENVRRLQHLKFLSFHGVQQFDDWCLDRVSGSEFGALEVLDVSGTAVTERGLVALYRVPTLRMLIVDNAQVTRSYELTCALLEELMPELKVVNGSAVHSE